MLELFFFLNNKKSLSLNNKMSVGSPKIGIKKIILTVVDSTFEDNQNVEKF